MCSNNILQEKKYWFTNMWGFFQDLFSTDFKYIVADIYNT